MYTPDEKSRWWHVVTRRGNHQKKMSYFIGWFWVEEAPSFRNQYGQKTVYLNTSISDDWGLRKPRHSETNIAKKRYTLIPLFTTMQRVKEPPRHSETISTKKRYTLTHLFPTIEGWGAPPSFRNHFSQKTVYLNSSISDDGGLRSPPVIQKLFQPKNGIS